MKKATLFLFALLFLSTTAVYSRPMHGPGRQKGFEFSSHSRGLWFGNMERLKKHLDLTDEQVKKISQINLIFKKKQLKQREQLAPKRIQLQELLLAEKIDLTKARALLKSISEVEVEIRMLMIEHRVAIENILNKDQKIKLRLEKKHRHRRYERKGLRRNH